MRIDFLHTHPYKESSLGLDDEHVIVDKKDLDQVMGFLIQNPYIFQALLGKEQFNKQWQDFHVMMIKDESYPPGYPKPDRPEPPEDKDEWIPGILGLRFSKWLDRHPNFPWGEIIPWVIWAITATILLFIAFK